MQFPLLKLLDVHEQNVAISNQSTGNSESYEKRWNPRYTVPSIARMVWAQPFSYCFNSRSKTVVPPIAFISLSNLQNSLEFSISTGLNFVVLYEKVLSRLTIYDQLNIHATCPYKLYSWSRLKGTNWISICFNCEGRQPRVLQWVGTLHAMPFWISTIFINMGQDFFLILFYFLVLIERSHVVFICFLWHSTYTYYHIDVIYHITLIDNNWQLP